MALAIILAGTFLRAVVAVPMPGALLAAGLDADAASAACGPAAPACVAGALVITAIGAVQEVEETLGSKPMGNYCMWEPCTPEEMREQFGTGPQPVPEEPECQPNQDDDVNMQPDPSAPNDGPCKVTCKDCHFSFGTTSKSSTTVVDFTNGLSIDNWKITGGLVFQCSGEGKGTYKLVLADAQNKFGMKTAQQCARVNVNYEEEVDFNVEINAQYTVEASGYIEADFELDAWSSSQGYTGSFDVTGVEGFFNGEFDAAASVTATVKDLLLINNEIVGGLGITTLGSVEVSGAAVQVDADLSQAYSSTTGPYEAYNDIDFTECMQAPNVTGTAELDFLVIGPGGETGYTKHLLTGTYGSPIVPYSISPIICGYYDEE